MEIRGRKTYYDVLCDLGSTERVKKIITINALGFVTDSIETKSFALIRANLYDGLVGEVLRIDEVKSIEKPTKIQH